MRRREFIALLSGAAVAGPLPLGAQSQRVPRVALLIALAENDPEGQARVVAFRQSLEELGWTVGRNLQIDSRWGLTDDERARAAVADLLRQASGGASPVQR